MASRRPSIRRLAVAVLALTAGGALLAKVPGSGARVRDSVTLADERIKTALTAYRGRYAWSTFDSEARVFRVAMASAEPGSKRVLAIAPRKVQFDLDLGPDGDGGVVAVYSRCEREPTVAITLLGTPSYFRGQGCRLFRFDPERGRERRLSIPLRRGSLYQPSVWRRRLAFVFVPRGGPVLRRRPEIWTGRLRGARVDRLRRVQLRPIPRHRSEGAAAPPGPTSLDIDGRRMAFVTEASYDSYCRYNSEERTPDAITGLWMSFNGRERARRRLRACETERHLYVAAATVSRRHVAALRIDRRRRAKREGEAFPPPVIRVIRFASARAAGEQRCFDGDVRALAVDGDRLLLGQYHPAINAPGSRFRISLTSFRSARRC